MSDLNLKRMRALEEAVCDEIVRFRRTPAGAYLTYDELLRTLHNVWHELGERYLKRTFRPRF